MLYHRRSGVAFAWTICQEGVALEVKTRHHRYTIVNRGHGEALISGHPSLCPEPTPGRMEGQPGAGPC